MSARAVPETDHWTATCLMIAAFIPPGPERAEWLRTLYEIAQLPE